MIIGIVSDTHFGFSRFEEDAHEQGKRAILEAAKKCDLLLLPGDIFDVRVPKPETIAQVAQILVEAGKIMNCKACAKQVAIGSKPQSAEKEAPAVLPPIVAIHGTHERRPRELVNPIQLMEAAGLLMDAHNKTLVFEKGGEKAAISGIGGVPDDLAKAALENMQCAPLQGAFNVFMLHQSFSEFIPSGEEMLSLEDLPAGYDLHVCGHLHKRSFLKNNSIIIPGSTVVTQLREEEQEEKGFVLYDTEKKEAQFVPIGSRKFILRKITVENADAHAIKGAIEAELNAIGAPVSNAPGSPIIKIKISGTLSNGLSPSDLRAGAYGKNVFIETAFSSGDLKEKLQSIRSRHDEKLSASEYGLKLLRERLNDAKIAHFADEETFMLLQEDAEEFVKRIKEQRMRSI
ncbi:metallophosphoesterase family protein [Candidatus Micrarchaeota archaeon]|nr:metallophosphoesterase family protein [Candidatus Micrarchaeota archaeon]